MDPVIQSALRQAAPPCRGGSTLLEFAICGVRRLLTTDQLRIWSFRRIEAELQRCCRVTPSPIGLVLHNHYRASR